MSKYENVAIKRMEVVEKRGKTSETALEAIKRMLQDEQVKEEIKSFILVTQEGDFLFPATAFVLHQEVGLPQNCIVYDINLGTDGFLTALEITCGLLCSYANNAIGLVVTAEQGQAVAALVGKEPGGKAEFSHRTYPDLWDAIWESRWEKGKEVQRDVFINLIKEAAKRFEKDSKYMNGDYIILPQREMKTFFDSSVLIPMEIMQKTSREKHKKIEVSCMGVGAGCSITEALLSISYK